MSVVINTNSAATAASYNLSATNSNLQRSLNRLSSGQKIVTSSDDAGGLAVSMKMTAALRRTEATQANVNNAISFLQTQDGVLKNADKILNRMSELATLALDVTKTTDDRSLYNRELGVLQSQLFAMCTEEFNGVSLFTGGANPGADIGINPLDIDTTLVVSASEDGSQTIGITQADLEAISYTVGTANGQAFSMQIDSYAGAQASVGIVRQAIQNLAELRANNGAEISRLTFASDMLSINKINLESANSRIVDVDVAQESTQLARFNILQQAGTAMLAQANQATQSILRLLS